MDAAACAAHGYRLRRQAASAPACRMLGAGAAEVIHASPLARGWCARRSRPPSKPTLRQPLQRHAGSASRSAATHPTHPAAASSSCCKNTQAAAASPAVVASRAACRAEALASTRTPSGKKLRHDGCNSICLRWNAALRLPLAAVAGRSRLTMSLSSCTRAAPQAAPSWCP